MSDGNDQFYSIKSKNGGRALDVCQDADKKGMLIIYDFYGGPNQLFMLKPNGNAVELVSKQSGKSLTIVNSSSESGALIFEEESKNLEGQLFKLQ
jgi:hypothetical protein